MLSTPQPQPSAGGGLGDIFGGGATSAPAGGNDFGADWDQPAQDNGGGDDWAADMFGGDGDAAPPLDFAKAPLYDAMAASQAGAKGKSGLQVRAHFFLSEQKTLQFGIEMTN